MQRYRTIAAAPVRSASAAWQLVVTLLADTLERSEAIPAGSVPNVLGALVGLGPAMIAAGHLQASPLVLVDDSLHLTIKVVTDDAAFSVDENLNPVPGGGSATLGWTLYLPTPKTLASSVEAAAASSVHLSTETPPADAAAASDQSAAAKAGPVDLDRVRALG